MTCQEALSLLYDVIDKEASEIDVQQVKDHLQNCQHCSEIYKVEEAVNQLLREKIENQKSASEMESLKDKVLAQLDAIDTDEEACACSMPHAKKKSTTQEDRAATAESAFKFGRILALAAALVVVLGAGWFGMALLNHGRDFQAIEDAHFAVAEHVDELPSAYLAAAQVSETMHYELAPVVAGFELIGGQTETIAGVDVHHFVYRNHEHLISVFVASSDQLPVPDSIIDSPVVKDNIEFYLHHCRGCNLAYHRMGDAIVVTATEDHDIQLLDFVPGRGTI